MSDEGSRGFTVTPIGVLRTPFVDRADAPRQPRAGESVRGTIELANDARFEHALEDLELFSHVWVLFWFHLNEGWHAKVRPPRSAKRRGVFATRAPYRPNPLGLSALRLDRIEGTVLHVSDVDVLDGTPVLDVKPYIPYTDAIAGATHGWLDEPSFADFERPRDPKATVTVLFSNEAEAELAFLAERHGIELRSRIEAALSLGATPHPYRRIRKEAEGYRLAIQEWRACFTLEQGVATVYRIVSGYRASELFGSEDPALSAHREFATRFGVDGPR